MRDFVLRIDQATPPDRDRSLDGLRALAILGVVLGHWLVTGLVVDSGTLHGDSPLKYMPGFAPVSWVLQTLAVFFFVGGEVGAKSYASAAAKGTRYWRWLGARMGRLGRPVAVVLAVWSVAACVMLAAGVDQRTVQALCKLVWSPLWFLLVLTVLTVLTPLVSNLHPVWPLVVVLLVDVIRFGLDGPAGLASVNVVAGWLVPYCLGAAGARQRLRGTGWFLLLGGAATTAALVYSVGYPAVMVGVPGLKISNLDPPTLVVVTFGLAQCGAAILLTGPLRRGLRRPVAWAAVAVVNLFAMTVFLWHQTAMIAITALGALTGAPRTGLQTAPDSIAWVLARLLWLPAFALALCVCWAVFGKYEQRRSGSQGGARDVGGGRPTAVTAKR
ncbi:acyltransferase [Streptomyces violaceoruber]|uniref:acyltransferase family protein n=1 Tax=Streptomyces violaceoruber group TaxID=2867121 RepID=UPI0033FC41FA